MAKKEFGIIGAVVGIVGPLIRTVDEILDYSLNIVLPMYVRAGLLEVSY